MRESTIILILLFMSIGLLFGCFTLIKGLDIDIYIVNFLFPFLIIASIFIGLIYFMFCNTEDD